MTRTSHFAKRLLAFLLAALMCFSAAFVASAAEEEPEDPPAQGESAEVEDRPLLGGLMRGEWDFQILLENPLWMALAVLLIPLYPFIQIYEWISDLIGMIRDRLSPAETIAFGLPVFG